MIREIFMKMHSEEYAEEVMRQVKEDAGRGGFEEGSVAIFGKPNSGKFEFVFTGRHTTRRCDGDSVAGTAFGGPIFYGHASRSFYEKPHHPGNAYWFQAKRANEVFQMMDGKQRKMALLEWPRDEQGSKTVRLTGKRTGLPGIPMTELSRDQRDEVRNVLNDLLVPFRKEDREESLKLIEKNCLRRLAYGVLQRGRRGRRRRLGRLSDRRPEYGLVLSRRSSCACMGAYQG